MKKKLVIMCLFALTACECGEWKIRDQIKIGNFNIEASNYIESSSFLRTGCIDLTISNLSGSGFAYTICSQNLSGERTITYEDIRIVISDTITIRNIETGKELWLFQFTQQNDGSFILEQTGHYVIAKHFNEKI